MTSDAQAVMPSHMMDQLTEHHEDTTTGMDTTIDNNAFPYKNNDLMHDMTKDLTREVILSVFSGESQIKFADFTRQDFSHTLLNINPVQLLCANQVIRQRLAHYKFLHFDSIRIKMIWNTSIQQDGMGWLYWSTSPGPRVDNENLTCITACPGVEVNFARNNSVELDIPWYLPTYWMNLTSLDFAGGVDPSNFSKYNNAIRLQYSHVFPPFNPNSKLSFTVYAQFVNPVVSGLTIDADAALVASFTESLRKGREVRERARPQANLGSEPVRQARTGIVSGVADGVSRIASALSTIPTIGSIASAVGGFSDMVGGVAAMFGFGKPHDVAVMTKVYNQPYKGLGVPVSEDHGEVLANQVIANVDPKHGNIITTQDEMSLSYVGERSGIVSLFAFPMDVNAGEVLWSQVITPCRMYDRTTTQSRTYTPGQATARNFDMVSFESVCLEFSCSKTAFHNGVLEVSYMPITSESGNAIHEAGGDAIQAVLETKLVSITNTDRFTVEIPLVFETPWINCQQPFASIVVRAKTPLTLVEGINPAVRIAVYQSFKNLKGCTWAPVPWFGPAAFYSDTTFTNEVNWYGFNLDLAAQDSTPKAKPQINLGVASDLPKFTFGQPKPLSDVDISVTSGDVTADFRPLCRTFVPVSTTFSATGGVLRRIKTHRAMAIDDVFTDADRRPIRLPNVFNFCSLLYWFNRGGVRVKTQASTSSKSDTSHSVLMPCRNDFESTNPGYYNIADYAFSDINQVELPQGSECRFFYTWDDDAYVGNRRNILEYSTKGINSRYFISAADDFSYHGLHGFPTLDVIPTTYSLTDPIFKLPRLFNFPEFQVGTVSTFPFPPEDTPPAESYPPVPPTTDDNKTINVVTRDVGEEKAEGDQEEPSSTTNVIPDFSKVFLGP